MPRRRGLSSTLKVLPVAAALLVGAATAAYAGVPLPLPPVPPLPTSATAFYEPPSPLPDGAAGDVIKTEEVPLSLYPEARATRVMYLSRNTRGDEVPVTAILLSPIAQAPGDANPVVVHTPGTRGLADHCAPSKQADVATVNPGSPDYSLVEYHEFLLRGISVILTDYLGQGTPGLPEYLVGPSEGYNGLDALRAAQRVPGSGLSSSSPVGITGYSQGGQAAAWTAELQPEYAPELDLRGVLAGGVPADMEVEVNHLSGNPTAGAGFGIASIVGLAEAHPELDLDSRLTPQGREIVERVKQSCYVEDLAGFATLSIDDITEPNILADPEWQAAYGESLLGTRAPGAPAFVYHTTSDTIVPFAQGQKLYGDWCSEGADVVFQKIPGLEHLSGVVIGSPAGVAWMSDRLAGKPVESGCREVGLL